MLERRTMKKNSVAKRGDCERAATHHAIHTHGCLLVRKAIRTQFQSVDFFASDVVGKRSDGSHVYIQATAGQSSAVSTRRKKLEKIPWHPSDTVELVQLVQTENPANARLTSWFFRVHSYGLTLQGNRIWHTKETAIPVPKEWFIAYKTEEEKEAARLKKEKKQ